MTHLFLSIRTMFTVPLFLSLLAAFPRQEAAPQPEFPKGEIIEKVVCQADGEQSYALYLPSSYDKGRAWPIIYCFDPRANGKNPVACFRAAAETFGYVLAGSNNSKNGPWEPSQKAIAAMLADTRNRFNINSARIYSAGFSGGAHVALLFPLVLRNPSVAGVIACCNGLPPGISLAGYPKDLAVLAATGWNDFNYWPTQKIGPELEAAGISHHLLVFPGEHQWPPIEAAQQALSWLELQAMKTGRREPDDAWIRARYAEDLERAQKTESAGQTVDAFLAYSDLVADFHSLCDVTEAEGAKERLQKSGKVEKYPEAARAAEKEEYRQFQEIERMVNAIQQSQDVQERRAWERKLRYSVPSSKGDAGETPSISFNPRRASYLAYVEILNAAARDLNAEKSKSAAALYEIATIIRPEAPAAWYNLAYIYAQNGETKKALAALENALADERVDPEAIEKDPDFAPLRKEAAYARIMEEARRRRNAEKKWPARFRFPTPSGLP
jgi:tetratricopeptide (TPR) repeat protein